MVITTIIIIIPHRLSIYTRLLLEALHTPTVIPGIYVTSSRELHSYCFGFLLFLCIWINFATILLRSQYPKPAVMRTLSCAFNN